MKPVNDHGGTHAALKVLYLCGLGILGALFLFAALSKLLDFQRFLQSLGVYGFRAHAWQGLAGIVIISLEILLGVWVLLGRRAGPPLQGSLALLSLFVLETSLHWTALQGASCGCFGPLSSNGPVASLLHQGIALLLVSGLLLATRGFPRLGEHWRGLRAGVGILVLTAGLAYAFVVYPPRGSAQAADTNSVEVRAVLSATCSHCREVAKEVGLLQKDVEPSRFTVYLGAQAGEEIDDFIKASGATLPYVPVTFRQLQSMSAKVPAIQIVIHGEIVRNWVGEMPSAAEVRNALAQVRKKSGELSN